MVGLKFLVICHLLTKVPEALSVTALTHIILDVSHRDAKKRSVLDIPETRDEVFGKILASPKVMQVLRSGTAQIILF